MDIGTWLSQVDPSQAGLLTLVWIGFFGLGLFLWKNVWPWFKTDYYPARERLKLKQMEIDQQNKQSEIAVMRGIQDTLLELKVIAGQQTTLLMAHDSRVNIALNAINDSLVKANGG